ncbi:hypothetical protein BJV78DRAFT_439813 [Lactifluus subvellereus]|nr:hypothetical protein BJV78DRAFT_439813 [Lactifluus subvellereus]
MLRGITRVTLRRGLHTTGPGNSAAGLSRHRVAMAVGASVIAASYLGWRMTLDSRTIALDSNSTSASKPTTRAPPTQASETLSAPHSDTSETQTGHEDEKDAVLSDEEASSQGAFDPVTGKINWDCPCLGGMAYGPCGMQFREAFSCFVFSEQEPKGIDCVEKFKAMQDCFRENPDVYGEEIMNDDDDDEELPAQSPTSKDAIPASTASASAEPSPLQVLSHPA